MTFAREILCPRCHNRFSLSQLLNLCSCGSPLLVRYDLTKASGVLAKSSLGTNSDAVALPRAFASGRRCESGVVRRRVHAAA